ncbi:hypothetical protein, partial [Micromonospora sp. NPDC050695]|uniref:hypothetical protein n=1 Tax=Micromonospora sp. NPDC050695 TaxID=3154938 RepID=UPI0033E7DC36
MDKDKSKGHVLAWAAANQSGHDVSINEYAEAYFIPYTTLHRWISGGIRDVTFTVDQQAFIDTAKGHASHQFYELSDRKNHALRWAHANQGGAVMGYTDYARRYNVDINNLFRWVSGGGGVTFEPDEQELINKAKQYWAHKQYTPGERKSHALAWAAANRSGPAMSYHEYERRYNVVHVNLIRWVSGGSGVTFTPEEQELINKAKQYWAHKQYTASERKSHALAWAAANRSGPVMSYHEYAEQHNVELTTLIRWVSGGSGVTFEPDEQELINKAKQRQVSLSTINETALAAVGANKKYAWLRAPTSATSASTSNTSPTLPMHTGYEQV